MNIDIYRSSGSMGVDTLYDKKQVAAEPSRDGTSTNGCGVERTSNTKHYL